MEKANRFFKVCPRSGKVVGINNKYFNYKWLIIILGLLSTIWYLIRFLPKPSRATYPCMQVAAPFAFTFIGYFSTLMLSAFGMRKAYQNLKNNRWAVASGFAIFAIAGIIVNTVLFDKNISLASIFSQTPVVKAAPNNTNAQVFTTPSALFEEDAYSDKTVVRVYDPTVSSFEFDKTPYEYYWRTFNTDKLQGMMEQGIMDITGEKNVAKAWKKILPNASKSTKVVVKVNLNNIKWLPEAWHRSNNTNPPTMVALTKSLEKAGIKQANITFMDPSREFHPVLKEEIRKSCPNVVMLGVTDSIPLSDYSVTFSEFPYTFKLPQAFMDANYLIDLCIFKSHGGGITAAMKNLAGLAKHPTLVLHEGRRWESNKTLHDLILNAEIKKRLKLTICEAIFGSRKATEDLSLSRLNKTELYPNSMCNSMFISRNPYLLDNVMFSHMNVEKNGNAADFSHLTRGYGWITHCSGENKNWAAEAVGAGVIVDRGGNMPPKELAFNPDIIEFISVRNGKKYTAKK